MRCTCPSVPILRTQSADACAYLHRLAQGVSKHGSSVLARGGLVGVLGGPHCLGIPPALMEQIQAGVRCTKPAHMASEPV